MIIKANVVEDEVDDIEVFEKQIEAAKIYMKVEETLIVDTPVETNNVVMDKIMSIYEKNRIWRCQ